MGHTHDPALIAGRRRELHLDKSIWRQYIAYIGLARNSLGFKGEYYWEKEKDSDFYKKYGPR